MANKPMPINRFALKAALRALDEQDIVIGRMVTVTWEVPANYATEGQSRRSHTGPLAYLDRERGFYEIKPSNKSPGHYRGYLLASTSTLTRATDQEAEPVPTKSKPTNPFMNLPKTEPEPKQRPVKRPAPGKTKVNVFMKGK